MAVERVITGNGGSVTIPAGAGPPTVAFVTEWAATFESDEHDVTTYIAADAGNYNVYRGGNSRLRGTLTCFFGDNVDTGRGQFGTIFGTQDREGVAGFVLSAVTGITFTFPALCTAIPMNAPRVGRMGYTVTFVSTGTVVQNSEDT